MRGAGESDANIPTATALPHPHATPRRSLPLRHTTTCTASSAHRRPTDPPARDVMPVHAARTAAVVPSLPKKRTTAVCMTQPVCRFSRPGRHVSAEGTSTHRSHMCAAGIRRAQRPCAPIVPPAHLELVRRRHVGLSWRGGWRRRRTARSIDEAWLTCKAMPGR
jgi:hypothetical protein